MKHPTTENQTEMDIKAM